jgi:hypothetical protein
MWLAFKVLISPNIFLSLLFPRGFDLSSAFPVCYSLPEIAMSFICLYILLIVAARNATPIKPLHQSLWKPPDWSKCTTTVFVMDL